MLRIFAISAASLMALITCIGCSAGQVLTTTGLIGGNLSLAQIIARGLGAPV